MLIVGTSCASEECILCEDKFAFNTAQARYLLKKKVLSTYVKEKNIYRYFKGSNVQYGAMEKQ